MTPSTKTAKHAGPVIDRVGEFDIIECESCGFVHILPIPTEKEMETVYREEYYATEKPLYLEHHREDLEWWKSSYQQRYDIFENHLPENRRRLLDVGSGPGNFLLTGRDRGWQVLGIEPSKQAAEYSRNQGLDIVEEFFTREMASKLEPFDVVHLSQVLEHISDPAELLRAAHDALSPDGLLCVAVPNDYNPLQKVLRLARKFEPYWLAPPHHINYFSFDSLSSVMERCGFEPIARTTSFPMEMFLLMGHNYVGSDKLGRELHGERKLFDLAFEDAGMHKTLAGFYRSLAAEGMGREAIVIAKRKEK